MARLSHRLVGSCLAASALVVALLGPRPAAQAPAFTLDDVLSYPFPDNLISAPAGNAVAWTFNERGQRNVYVATAPDFAARRVTAYLRDDGQELTGPVVFARRQVRSSTSAAARMDRTCPPKATCSRTRRALRSQPQDADMVGACRRRDADAARRRRCAGGGAAHQPGRVRARAPHLDCAARRIEARRAGVLRARDQPGADLVAGWNDDGLRLESRRPQLHRRLHGRAADSLSRPVDLARLVAGVVGATDARLRSCGNRDAAARRAAPLAAAAAALGDLDRAVDPATPGRRPEAREAWKSGKALVDSPVRTAGAMTLQWAADDRLVFMSYQDGWPHLYSLQHPGEGHHAGRADAWARSWWSTRRSRPIGASSSTTRIPVAIATTRSAPHLQGPVDGGAPTALTTGRGIEWTPGRHRPMARRSLSSRPPRSAHRCRRWCPSAGERRACSRPTAYRRTCRRRARHAGSRSSSRRPTASRCTDSCSRRRRPGAAAGAGLRARRTAAADAARLALHGLLRERLRREPIPRQSRLHRPLGQLSPRHRLRARVSFPGGRRRARRVGISGRAGRRAAAAVARRRRCRARRHLGRFVRRLPDGAGARPQLRRVRRRSGHPRRAQLESVWQCAAGYPRGMGRRWHHRRGSAQGGANLVPRLAGFRRGTWRHPCC